MSDYNGETSQTTGLLRHLLSIGAKLHGSRTRQEMLETILSQARKFTGAEAGSLYLVQRNQLRFVAVQNETMDTSNIVRHLFGQTIAISPESLAGFAALTGRIINIPDSYNLPEGTPFRINRELDAKTGYSARSILAIPLKCPDGVCVGVMQLFNRRDANGGNQPFEEITDAFIEGLVSTAAIAVHNLSLQEQLRSVHLNTIFRLSTIAEYRDADTGNHIQRVSRISELVARELSMPPDQVELIKYASPMHDVGKVAVPDAILFKPGHLTTEQRKIMEKHTIIGGEIFEGADDDVLVMAQDVALHHHERWDGKGYPDGLAGDQIALPSRIVGLADVFDAVVSRRCYKQAFSLDVALDILDQDSGKHFDPAVVKAFMQVLESVLESYPELRAA